MGAVPTPGAGEVDAEYRGIDGERVAMYVSAAGYMLMGVSLTTLAVLTRQKAGVEAGVAAFGEAAAAAPEVAAAASHVGPMILQGVSATQAGLVKTLSLIVGYSVEDVEKIAEPISAGGGRVITWGIEKATGIPVNSAIDFIEFGLMNAGVNALEHVNNIVTTVKGLEAGGKLVQAVDDALTENAAAKARKERLAQIAEQERLKLKAEAEERDRLERERLQREHQARERAELTATIRERADRSMGTPYRDRPDWERRWSDQTAPGGTMTA